MDEFLDLDNELNLSEFEYRDLLEGRATINRALTELTQDDDGETRDVAQLEDADGERFDALIARGEEVQAEIRRRDQARNVEQRQSRLAEFQSAAQQPSPASRPTPIGQVRGPEPTPRNDDPVDNPDSARFSILRAVDRLARNLPVNGYEGEVSQEIARRTGRQPQGFFVPWGLGYDARAASGAELRAFDTTAGAGMIPTMLSNRFIDVLRNRMVMSQLGANVMTDLVGDLDVPKKTATSTAYWVAEGVAPTESNMTAGVVQFTPKTVGAWSTITRKMRVQAGSASVENRVRQDLLDTVRIELDRVGLNGSGSGAQPQGILQNSSVSTIAIGTNGGPLTWALVVSLESDVAADNADIGNLAYVTSPAGRGHCKSVVKDSGSGMFLWDRDNQVNGYQAVATSQVPSNLTKGSGSNLTAMIFGNFRDATYALWTAFDVMVDPYSGATTGNTRIVVLLDADFKVERAESFAKIVDIDP